MFSLPFLILTATAVYGHLQVKHVSIIYRHGERTPVSPYPNDPWKDESLWPVRFGELTNNGKRQHLAVGKWLRRRYAKLISQKFDPKEVYIQSTDVDRTLMSAQANLAGLYPPTGSSVWTYNLPWQPIPVHTIPENQDEVLAMGRQCPKFEREYKRFRESVEYQTELKKHENLMNFLASSTGMKVSDYNDILDIYSTLYIETLNNFSLPKWTAAVYPDKMTEPACYSFTTQTGTPLLARLRVGPLFQKIVADMMKVVNSKNSTNYYKMIMYSAHDLNIGSILNAMGVFDNKCPAFTATILFELLYDDDTATYFVNLLYRNTTDIVQPHSIRIPKCGRLCPLPVFLHLYGNLMNVDWETECHVQDLCLIKFFLHMAAVFLVISLVFLTVNLYCIPRHFFLR